MSRISDVTNLAIRQMLSTMAGLFTKHILAINAGGAATIKTTGAIQYCIDGVMYTKAALAAVVLSTVAAVQQYMTGLVGYYVQPANTTAYYLVCLDSAGNVRVFQGPYAGYTMVTVDSGLPFTYNAAVIPDVDLFTYCPIGLIKVQTAAATFTPITDALDKAAITFTFFDLAGHIPSVLP